MTQTYLARINRENELKFKSTEYLNFSHFSHFAILGISLGNYIVSQKDLCT